MHVNLKITTAEEYFAKEGKEIDWEETNDPNLVTGHEVGAIQAILTIEVAIHVLRGCTGIDQLQSDTMVTIRRGFIDNYEREYGKKYIEYRDFY